MGNNNRRLVILVASVAVAAVAIGAAVAYRQGPQNANAEAAPLTGSPSPNPTPPASPTVPTSSPSKPTPTVKPSPTTTPTKAPTKAGPTKSTVTLAKLSDGRAPQATYLTGRTVRGGAGQDVKVPGTGDIWDVARLNQSVLAVVSNGTATEMLTIAPTGNEVVRRTPDISSIVTTEDNRAAAYVATRTAENGARLPGATVYAEEESVRKITLPDAWDARLLSYANGKVYFRAEASERASTWTLYEWVPGASKATVVKAVPQPTAISSDGQVAASLINLTDYNSCTNVVSIATGKRLWRTCDYQISGFTRDGTTAIGRPFYLDGYADGIASALDMKTGNLLHEWSGTFHQTVPEDDQHLLIRADEGEGNPGSIIRCTIATGACERATPRAKGTLLLAS